MNSLIHPNAQIAPDTKVGAHVRIFENVIIEPGCEIGDYCQIGHPTRVPAFSGRPLRLGPGAIVRSHTVLYEGSELGAGFESGHHVVVREGTKAGQNFRVGNFSDVEGDCSIGDYCRFHGYVHVGRGSRIGDFVWLFSLVTLTNDPLPPSHASEPVRIDDGVVVAVNVTVLPGTHLKRGAYVGAGGTVSGVIPAGAVVKDGTVVCGVHALFSMKHRIRHPWMTHFADAYPAEAQARITKLCANLREDSMKLNSRPQR